MSAIVPGMRTSVAATRALKNASDLCASSSEGIEARSGKRSTMRA